MRQSIVPGTYLKTTWVPEPGASDSHILLYLRPSKRFLYLGYWRGYEISCAAGTWHVEGPQAVLSGVGQVAGDFQPWSGPVRPFERALDASSINHTPMLLAQAELPGWGLLSWRGPFMYVGGELVIDPDGSGLPSAMADVEHWIARLVP
jgi:hypothetical protein